MQTRNMYIRSTNYSSVYNVSILRYFVCVIILSNILAGCKPKVDKAPAQTSAAAAEIEKKIADGKRLENINKDSLLIIADELKGLHKLSGNGKALVYQELFEGSYLWQSAYHKKAMEVAMKALGDAGKFKINVALPAIYGLIGNLHKETTNYDMAFKAADNGYEAAINNKDTASIIALLGLKAMFTRGLSLSKHMPQLNDKSIALNLSALKVAESSPKYEKLRIRFYNNIAQFYKDKKEFQKTYYYAGKAVELATKHDQQRSLTYSYSWLGEASCYDGHRERGLAYLEKALAITQKLKLPYREMEVLQSFYNVNRTSGNYEDAIKYMNIFRNMKDSLKVLDNVKQISELQVKYESAQKDQKINNLNAETKQANLKLYIFLLIFLLLLSVTAFFYLKEKKRKELMASSKKVLDEKLKNAQLELQHFTETIKQKNEIIEEFRTSVEYLTTENNNSARLENLENLLHQHLMTDENWNAFKLLFSQVHSGFFNNLKNKFPNLTPNDSRILALIKLNLTNKEMAPILGVTIEGIRKSKHRLRKKMDLPEDVQLETVVIEM